MKAKFPVSSFQFQRSLNASSGIALIGIIIAIVLMGLLGGSVLMLITTSSMESLQTMNWNKAFFAAESGVSVAKYYMTTNAAWYNKLPWTNTRTIGNASFSCVISTNVQSNVFVTAVGANEEGRWTSRWYPSASEITRVILVYKEGPLLTPRYRTCSNLRRLSAELTANSVFGIPQWQRIEACPLRNEFILVTQNSQRRIYAQTYSNGTWGSATQLNAAGVVPVASSRGFDVAYENLSGRGMVVYSINSATPQYRLWTSNSWSAPVSINVGATNPIYWIRLISKPGTNEIMCLARWQRTASANYSSAIIWNGSAWTNYIPLERECASQINRETLDASYSTNSALVVYINGVANARRIPKHRTYTSSGWSVEKSMTGLGGSRIPQWIRVEYSIYSTQAYAAISCSDSSLQGAYWRGTIWDAAYTTFSNNLASIIYRPFDIAWISQGNTLMAVYWQSTLGAPSYLLAAGGGASNYYADMVSGGSTDRGRWCVLKADPFTPEFYCLTQDNQSDVNLQRWYGTAWSIFPELETTTSDNNYNFTDFTFRRDSASTNCWPLR